MRIPASLIALSLFAACTHDGGAPRAASAPAASLDGTPWRLVAFEGHRLPEGPDARAITLRFDNGRISGQGPCNVLSGPYTREGERLRLGPLSTSKRLCPGEPSALETPYLAALQAVERARIEGEILLLDGPGVTLRLRTDTGAR